MFEAYKTCIQHYAVFRGRARRSEYWLFVLFNNIVIWLATGLAYLLRDSAPTAVTLITGLSGLYSLFILLPSLAVLVRRLHDRDLSGWFYFISFIPVIGAIILLVQMCKDGTPGVNRFGPSPKEPEWVPLDPAPAPPPAAPGPQLPSANTYAANDFEKYIATNRVLSPNELPKARVKITCVRGPGVGLSAEGEAVCVGRDPGRCQLVMPNAPGVSRVHCMAHPGGGGIELRDLGSSYGTFLSDGTKLEANKSVFLPSGSTIYIGSGNVAISAELV